MKYPARKLIINTPHILFVAIFSAALPLSLFAYATLYLSAGLAAILNAATSIFTALIAFIWLRQNINLKRSVGLLLGFLGVCFLVHFAGELDQKATLLAILAGLLGALSYAVNICFTKLYCRDISPLQLTTVSLFVGFLLLLPLMIYYWPLQPPSIKAWLSVIILGVVCTGLAFVMFFRLLAFLGASTTALVTLLIPVFATLWGSVWLNESMTTPMLLSGALVLLGAALASNLLGK